MHEFLGIVCHVATAYSVCAVGDLLHRAAVIPHLIFLL